tara:strand:+ start:73990 stop:75144 length:1155 start_codon:yes stop_codon:yes gene_type:complete
LTEEFAEIGHCGGQFYVTIKTGDDGSHAYSTGYRISNGNPASMVSVAVNSEGAPLGIVDLSWAPDANANGPVENPSFIQLLLASDRTGLFGHECPNCTNYWRTDGFTSRWKTVCPYCGIRAASIHFLTNGHRHFLKAFTEHVHEALNEPEDGEYIIDMDEVVKSVQAGKEAPLFYHADEAQQNQFNCVRCRTYNDILGRYGYCSSCGYRNNLSIIEADLDNLKRRIAENEVTPTEAIKLAVSALDAGGVNYIKQLCNLVPMTDRRRNSAGRLKFHNLEKFDTELSAVFDISVTKKFSDEDRTFLKKMFLRRHVYEHCGGVVDADYLSKSEDQTVKNGQEIRESKESAFRFIGLVNKLAKNLDDGFHEIISLNEEALEILSPSSP